MTECNCGYGGFHEPMNPNCNLNQTPERDLVTDEDVRRAWTAWSDPGDDRWTRERYDRWLAAHDAELSERVRNKDIADMRWLATARAEYDHVPNDISSTLAATEAERTLKTQHQSVSLVADILEGKNDGAGWLPSWLWDDWNERREGKQ